MLAPCGLPSTRGNPGVRRNEGDGRRPSAVEMTCVAVLVTRLGLEHVAAVEEEGLAVARHRALQLQRREVEVFLSAEGELIRRQRIQFLIRRHAEVGARDAGERRRGMLRDGDEREVAERRAIVTPAEALGRIGISSVGAEVKTRDRILRRHRVRERLHVLSAAEYEPSRWVESVCVDQDHPEPAQQVRVLQRRQRRIGLGHEEGIVRRQSRDELRIHGEVVGLDVTRRARSPVAVERLVHEELAPLRDHLFKAGRSCGRRCRIEPAAGGRVIDEADLTMLEPREQRAGTRQHEPVYRTCVRPDDECPIRKEAVKGRGAQRHRESVAPGHQGVGADLHQVVPMLRERGVTVSWLVVDQPEIERPIRRE